MKPLIQNEYGKLKAVVVSSCENFDPNSIVMNNETIKHYAKLGQLPKKEIMLKEQKNFWDVLKNLGVNVLIANQVALTKGQMFTRDLCFVIGKKVFISSMAKENRRKAIDGWSDILNNIDKKCIIKVPSNIFLEGGDVIIDGDDVYVGLGERTNIQAIDFLKEQLGTDYNIIPIKLEKGILHLDVVLTIINPNLAIVYKAGINSEDYQKLSKFDKIELNETEQFSLGTNVFAVDKNTIIVQTQHQRLTREIQKRELNVINVDYSEISKDGGALRCTTCPIVREII